MIRGGPSGGPQAYPPKRHLLKQKSHFTRARRIFILLIFLLRATCAFQKRLRVGVFVIVPGRVEKGSPPIFLEIFKVAFGAGNLTTCVGNGISHCTLYCALYCTLYCILYCRNNFCTAGNNFCLQGSWEGLVGRARRQGSSRNGGFT